MRDVLKWTVIGGVFLLPFVPLLVTGNLFFSYITGKNFAFRIIVEIIFAAWVLLALYDKQYRPRFSWVSVSLAAFVVIMFVAGIFGAAPEKSIWSNFERMEGWVTLIHLLLYFIVVGAVLTSARQWRYFFNTSLVAAVLVSLYAFAQFAGMARIAQSGVRIDATLGNAIYMAGYMLFHAFIALLLLAQSRRMWMRALYGALALMFMFLLVQTATRGTILGLLGGLLAAALSSAWLSRDNPIVRQAALIGVGLLFVASAAFYLARNTAFIQESPVWSRIASISLEAGETRFTIWSIALEGIKERPILGWGQNNFDYVFDAHYRPSLYAQEQWFDRVHNTVLDWLIAGGVLGLLSYLFVWAAVLYAIGAKPRLAQGREPFSALERGILFGALVGYGIHNMFVFDNLTSYFLFATILAFVHARVAKEVPRVLAITVDARTVANIAVPVVTVALCLSLYYVNVPHLRAAGDIIDALSAVTVAMGRQDMPAAQHDLLLMKGLDAFKQALARGSFADQEIREQLVLSAQRVYLDERASAETKNAYVELAESELLKQVHKRPDAARMHTFLSTLYRMVGAHDKALEQLAIAETLSPNKQSILFDIGFTYIEVKEYEKAKEIFKRALTLAPEYVEARANYIVAAIYAGDDALVAELSAPPYDALYRTHDRILQAYYLLRKYEATLLLLNARIDQEPGNLELRISKAAVLHESGDTAAAIATLEQTIKDFPEFKPQGEQFLSELRKTL